MRRNASVVGSLPRPDRVEHRAVTDRRSDPGLVVSTGNTRRRSPQGFLLGWPSVIAVIINYIKRDEAHGTWLESHFTRQIRTFWFALLWAVAIGLASALLLVGVAVWAVGPFALVVRAIYRFAPGWLRLEDSQSVA